MAWKLWNSVFTFWLSQRSRQAHPIWSQSNFNNQTFNGTAAEPTMMVPCSTVEPEPWTDLDLIFRMGISRWYRGMVRLLASQNIESSSSESGDGILWTYSNWTKFEYQCLYQWGWIERTVIVTNMLLQSDCWSFMQWFTAIIAKSYGAATQLHHRSCRAASQQLPAATQQHHSSFQQLHGSHTAASQQLHSSITAAAQQHQWNTNWLSRTYRFLLFYWVYSPNFKCIQ